MNPLVYRINGPPFARMASSHVCHPPNTVDYPKDGGHINVAGDVLGFHTRICY